MIYLDLDEQELSDWATNNFPDSPPYHPLLGVGEEVGELFHAHLKREQRIRGSEEVHHAKAKDAIGDIVIYLLDYCRKMGYSFKECVEQAWSQVRVRNWRNKSTLQSPVPGYVVPYGPEYLTGD